MFAPDAFAAEDGFRVIEPARLDAVLHKDEDRFRLVGRLTTRLEVPCSRCLEPFEVPVDGRFDFRYLPLALAGNPDEDADRRPVDHASTATSRSISRSWCASSATWRCR